MALVIKRYLAVSDAAKRCVDRVRELERWFLDQMASLRPGCSGVTLENYADRNMDVIKRYNAMSEEAYLDFVREEEIAPALCSNDVSSPSFDSFFDWDINCMTHGGRLFLEVRASGISRFPIEREIQCLREIDDQKFFLLTGKRQ